jgi:hypothetical protein
LRQRRHASLAMGSASRYAMTDYTSSQKDTMDQSSKYRELMDLAIKSQKYGTIERYMTPAPRAESLTRVRDSPFFETLNKPAALSWEQLNTPYF